ncbi:MAG: hypothetical protein CMJ25_15085 [Phycisphaerae bacterium]|nr:hypothetical protein [Phycisphaerae bacterium]|tara:strand:+ start:210 stop:611 length:402 start_codon:yes stop_codon:yes gene_type:complete
MALTSQITARNFAPIGQIGETPGFSDFTPTQIAQNGYAQVVQRKTEFLSDTLFSGIITESTGKVAVVDATKTAVDAYIATVFDIVGSTVDVKIFLNNVVFSDKADAAVIDTASKYVERDPITTVYWTIKVQIS